MYGGKIDATGNVSSQLWVFNIPRQSWTQAAPKAKEQYAVVGHSAHIVTLEDESVVMLVIFGHCPLYGYISNVQEYNLGEFGPHLSFVSNWFENNWDDPYPDSKTRVTAFFSFDLYLGEIQSSF